jgi:hypothetical protein
LCRGARVDADGDGDGDDAPSDAVDDARFFVVIGVAPGLGV